MVKTPMFYLVEPAVTLGHRWN